MALVSVEDERWQVKYSGKEERDRKILPEPAGDQSPGNPLRASFCANGKRLMKKKLQVIVKE